MVIWALFLLKDNWPFCKILCNLVWILEKYIEKVQGFFKFIKTQVRCHLSSRNQLKIWEIHANTIRPSSSPNKHWGHSGFTNTRLNVSVSLFLDAWMKHRTIFLHYLESDMVFQLHCAANLRLKQKQKVTAGRIWPNPAVLLSPWIKTGHLGITEYGLEKLSLEERGSRWVSKKRQRNND